MRYAVISDVHGNITALRAVLSEIKKRGIRDILFLGDSVGYGPDPDECIETLYSECRILLAGNHDMAVVGLTDIGYFNPYARAAIEWTKKNIKTENIFILKSLNISEEIEDKRMLLVHSTPKEPSEWHYLYTLWDAEVNFHYFENQICLLGHSHVPFMVERLQSAEMLVYKEEMRIQKQNRYIINVGSVGQPRDRDPRACYVVIDDASARLFRVEYDIKQTQERMKRHGLPAQLIERLNFGV